MNPKLNALAARRGEKPIVDRGAIVTELRHRCRNSRCRSKLSEPTDSPHKAFCARGCHSQFYRRRCIVCEKELPAGRSDRRFCRKPSCRNEYRRNPVLYGAPEPRTAPGAGSADLALRNPIKSGIKAGEESGRPWRIAAGELSGSALCCATVGGTEAVEAINRTNARHWRERCLINRDDPPVNILGGYKFPDAPAVDLTAPPAAADGVRSDWKPCVPSVPIADDLVIPAFLRRTGGDR
jgi:hypothetical protein